MFNQINDYEANEHKELPVRFFFVQIIHILAKLLFKECIQDSRD